MIADFIKKHKKIISDVILSTLLVLIFAFNLLSYFEYKFQDAAYQKPTSVSPDIVVIGIDVKSLNKFGRFQQWSRQIMADGINILNSSEEYKPAVIAIDVLYAGESENEEADGNLAKAAADGGNVVFASLAYFGEELTSRDDLTTRRVVTEHEIPYPSLAKNADYGIANGILDSGDSVVRNARLKLPYNGETLYSFPCQIYKKYTGGEPNDFLETHNTAFITYYGKPGEYYGSEEFGWSFADIFEEDFEPEYFADCIVLIGPYAPAFMDSYYTPMSQKTQMYGVEVHANVVQMLLEGNFKEYVSWGINFALLIFFIAAAVALAKFVDVRILFAVLAALGAGYYFLALHIFNKGYILTLLYPVFSLAVIYIYQVIYGYILERIEKLKLKGAFKKYVDPKLVDKLIESGEADSNEVGVKKNIAVLFVDVRGFTPMTEALKDQPELVVKILNEYLELTSTSVFNNGGSVDKFVGDATMALFNGFFPTDNYVFKAVKAAWDMVCGAVEVNASIKEKYNVDVGFGIGVNCGDAIVGNLGPSFRKDYTAIGDTVNTAARLESNAKRSEVLISKDVYDIIKDRIEVKSVGEMPLKGKNIKLEIFSVTNIL